MWTAAHVYRFFHDRRRLRRGIGIAVRGRYVGSTEAGVEGALKLFQASFIKAPSRADKN
jgi:hypothetical protein